MEPTISTLDELSVESIRTLLEGGKIEPHRIEADGTVWFAILSDTAKPARATRLPGKICAIPDYVQR